MYPSLKKTPCYIIDSKKIRQNLEILKGLSERTGCKILLAQKAFSMFYLYPMIGKYLAGTAASGLYEAKLGFEEMGGETHVFSAAYRSEEIPELLQICDHIIFNSFNQWASYRELVLNSGCKAGIRINPMYSTQEHAIYDPCAKGSRLGVSLEEFRHDMLEGISGLHLHTLCEQNSDALAATLEAVEAQFGQVLHQMEWINLGGGHHITRKDYDIKTLEKCILHLKETYGLQVYLEPGEAIALDAGYLAAEILDIVHNDIDIAILDASAACHMPDVIEMPYRPRAIGAGESGEKPYTYRLAGATCLAGDVIGDYSFDEKLKIGGRIFFEDMAIYTMVKNNTFNGAALPSIAVAEGTDGNVRIVREFGYDEFKRRLS
jgi:carboxynorspermidine decarboxylase